jgi:protein TonB
MTVVNVYEYDYVEVQPQFPGGERALMNFINNTREYPYHAYHNRVQGRVVCGFIVNVDGSISNIEIIKGVEPSLNREAVRVISEMPKWKVGRLGGDAVPVHCVLPIIFRR